MPHATVTPLLDLLHQMRTMIDRLDDVDYAMPAPGRTSGGIGGHVRHCLDHVSALVEGTRTGLCAYDRRQRGTLVETSRAAAMDAIADTTIALLHFDPAALDGEILVETLLDPAGGMVVSRSSVRREVAFLISHTVHHNAIVGQLMQTRGLNVAARFGLAPATPLDSARTAVMASGVLACAP